MVFAIDGPKRLIAVHYYRLAASCGHCNSSPFLDGGWPGQGPLRQMADYWAMPILRLSGSRFTEPTEVNFSFEMSSCLQSSAVLKATPGRIWYWSVTRQSRGRDRRHLNEGKKSLISNHPSHQTSRRGVQHTSGRRS